MFYIAQIVHQTRSSKAVLLGASPRAAVAMLQACIRKAGGELLRECSLFDVYTGAPIPEGQKSVSFSLKMRADDQTLTDDHAEEIVNAVLEALKNAYHAVMR